MCKARGLMGKDFKIVPESGKADPSPTKKSGRDDNIRRIKNSQPRLSPCDQSPNLSAARALALAASSSRFFGGAFVSSERRSRIEMPAISSTAF
jgi:hypothetical protein